MKSLKIFCALIVLLFLFLDPGKVLANDELVINGKAVILMDANSGRVIYERNSREQLPPASLTKIMTGFLTAESGNLDRKVTISKHAADTPECTVYLEPGEVLTRMDLLYAAMLPSANDACVSLAESIAGSEVSFLKMMNQRAEDLGLKNTHFVNPHGLHDDDHYSTAYDLAILAQAALANPVFAKVVATPRKVIPWESRPDEDRILLNQNRLLYRYDDAVGVKTGYTRQAGNCVVGAAKRGDMLLIAVSMNSSTVYEDLALLFDYGFDNYHMASLGKINDASRNIELINADSKTVTAVPAADIEVAVTDDEAPYLAYSLSVESDAAAPIKKGDVLGTCILLLKGEQIGSIDLIAEHDVSIKRVESSSLPTTTTTITKWAFPPLGCLILIVMFRNSNRLQNGLKRMILLLLRKRIPSQYRRPRY